ncbi:MAG: TetR/AcrR family transcriptional regulator [Gammaproteobacteria bacterium]
MGTAGNKRERLIDAANMLIYSQGFHRTTLADIAKESGVPLGNVYYYFKTKEDICAVVIERRKQDIKEIFNGCCKENDPKSNLKRFMKFFMMNGKDIVQYGCPVGSLCQELDKMPSRLTDRADSCMHDLLGWTNKQFRALGYKNSYEMAFELIARIQGIMLLGHALRDQKHIKKQLRSTCEWIDSL